MTTKRVWVAAFQPGEDGCVGGFEWRHDESEARNLYGQWCIDQDYAGADLHFFSYDVGVNDTAGEITDLIDAVAWWDGYDNAIEIRKGKVDETPDVP